MSKKRLSPGANAGNFLLLNEDQKWCCGQGDTPAAQCNYTVTSPDEIQGVRGVEIDGTDYFFPSILQPQATTQIEAALKEALGKAGYEPTDISVTYDSGTGAITVVADPQQAVFNNLHMVNGLGAYIKQAFVETCP